MSGEDLRERALRQAVREARAERPAEVDWSDVEQRLVQHAERSAPAKPRSRYPLAWGGLAVAAAASLWLIGERSGGAVAHAPPRIIEATQPLRRNGEQLAFGSRVSAEDREVSVEHAARATWTLSAHSSATLTERGERIGVRLERGSVLSEVAPSSKPETFVVEAAGTRVAVHGTVFRVTIDGDRVIVLVREGTVAVGPRGSVPAFFLKAPAHGDFAADGRSGNIDGRPLGDTRERRAEPLKLASARPSATPPLPSASPPVADAEVPLEPSISEIETGVARIVDVAAECFSRNTKSAEGVQITVRTALSLKVEASGSVTDVDFQPPLSPDAESCAASEIAHITFAPSQQGAQVTRMLELKR